MSEIQELGKLINKTVEASLLKTQKQISDLQNGYIRRNNALNEEITRLRAQVMFYDKEKERYNAAQILVRKLKKIMLWTFGGIISIILILLLLIIAGLI